jgi:hypothetical protein
MNRAAWWLAALVLICGGVGRASAGPVTLYTLFKSTAYQQTSNSQPTTPSSFFVNGGVGSATANDLTGGSVNTIYPLTVADANDLGWDAGFFSTLAAMNAAFPDGGTNHFTVTSNSQGTLNDTLTLPNSALFTSNVPYLTNFSQLQGMNPAAPLTVTFPATSAVPGSNGSAIFFGIFGTAAGSGALADSATSFVIPANTLLPNTTYTFELDYSNRLNTTSTGGFSGATGIAGYDVRTDGTFTTGPAVPEPASLLLLAIGAAGAAGYGWQRRKRAAK